MVFNATFNNISLYKKRNLLYKRNLEKNIFHCRFPYGIKLSLFEKIYTVINAKPFCKINN
jgi:hypothetical protein